MRVDLRNVCGTRHHNIIVVIPIKSLFCKVVVPTQHRILVYCVHMKDSYVAIALHASCRRGQIPGQFHRQQHGKHTDDPVQGDFI